MDNFPVVSLNIPFGKYIDPNIVDRLRLVKYEQVHDLIDGSLTVFDDELFLFAYMEDWDIRKFEYLCCYFPEEPGASGETTAVTIMEQWLMDRLAENRGAVKLLKPKHDDWYRSFFLAEIIYPRG